MTAAIKKNAHHRPNRSHLTVARNNVKKAVKTPRDVVFWPAIGAVALSATLLAMRYYKQLARFAWIKRIRGI